MLWAFEILAFFALLGFYDATRFQWCWRIVGGIVCIGYCAYLVSMISNGQWIGERRGRASSSVVNALLGLFVFGYPGFMFAVFGRFTWTAEPEDHIHDKVLSTDIMEPQKD